MFGPKNGYPGSKDRALATTSSRPTNPKPTNQSKRSLTKPKPIAEYTNPISSYLPTRMHNCLPPSKTGLGLKRTLPVLNRKSVSLVELPAEDRNRANTLIPRRKCFSREREERGKMVRPSPIARSKTNMSSSSTFTCKTDDAGSPKLANKVIQRFVINAWRRRSAEVIRLKTINKKLFREVEYLNVDVHVLRNDLKCKKMADNESFFNDSIELQVLVDQEKEVNEELIMNLKTLETEKEMWKSRVTQIKEEKQLLQEKLYSTDLLNAHLKEQCSVYHKSLTDSNEKVQQLQKELESTNLLLNDKAYEMDVMKNKCLDLQRKVEALIERNQQLAKEKDIKEKQIKKYTEKIGGMENEMKKLKVVHDEQSSAYEALQVEYEKAMVEVEVKNRTIERLEDTVEEYEAEEEDFKHKVKRLAVSAFGLTLKILPFPNPTPF